MRISKLLLMWQLLTSFCFAQGAGLEKINIFAEFDLDSVQAYRMFDKNHGIFFINNRLYKTTDGKSFSMSEIEGFGSCKAISFYNSEIGYAADSDGQLFRTKDAGNTWVSVGDIELDDNFSSFRNALELSAVSENILFIRTDYNLHKYDNRNNNIVKVLDYISTFPETWYPGTHDSYFVNENIGWVVGDFTTVCKTTDSGKTWFSSRHTNGSEWDYNCGYVFALDSNTAWVSVFSDFAQWPHYTPMITTDGGRTWEYYHRGLEFGDSHVRANTIFIDNSNGWILHEIKKDYTYRHVMEKTTDGGETWTRYEPPAIPYRMFDSTFTGINNNSFYMSCNGGADWVKKFEMKNNRYIAIDYSEGKTVAVGQDGVIVSSDKTGENEDNLDWKKESLGNYYFRDCKIRSNTIWVAGNKGTVFWKDFSDESWNSKVFDYPHSFTSIAVLNENSIVVSGENKNSIIKTTDKGNTWTECTFDTDLKNTELFFITPEKGYLLGTSSDYSNTGQFLYYTENGGYSWVLKDSFQNTRISTLYFTDENEGWLGNYIYNKGIQLLHTTDGGTTWQNHDLFGNAAGEYYDVAIDFNETGFGIVAGKNGSVYFTRNSGETWALFHNDEDAKYTGAVASSEKLFTLDLYGKIDKYTGKVTGIDNIKNEQIIDNYYLSQNYPNPFNPSTNINFSIKEAGTYKLSVYNMLGEEVKVLVNKQLPTGQYSEKFDASGLTSGVYIYRLSGKNVNLSNKMILIK